MPSPAPSSVVAAFLAALDPAARAGFEGAEDRIAAAIVRHAEAGRSAWPDVVAIDDAVYAAETARRLGAIADPEIVDKLRGSDLYLAIACSAGQAKAHGCFERTFLDEVDHAGRRLKATPEQTDDVRAHVRRVLLVSEPGRPAATLAFAGRGDLRGYVKVIATRELVRVVNRDRREASVGDDLVAVLAPASDPELSLLRARYRGDVDDAIRSAVAALDDRNRTLLRYHLVDGWSIDQIGRLYGVHRATAARWVTAARDALGDQIRRAVAARLSVGLEDVDSIIRLVRSRIDVSLERLLVGVPDDAT